MHIYFDITADNYTHFVVNWNNHFVNELQEKGKFLHKILPYPTQFEDLQDDGILMSKKYVDYVFECSDVFFHFVSAISPMASSKIRLL